jgi:sorbitol/mannitol transport system permease protein
MKFDLSKNAVMNLLKVPSIIVLFLWMIVPLSITLYFSVIIKSYGQWIRRFRKL